jgi:hypothetical protein
VYKNKHYIDYIHSTRSYNQLHIHTYTYYIIHNFNTSTVCKNKECTSTTIPLQQPTYNILIHTYIHYTTYIYILYIIQVQYYNTIRIHVLMY